MPISTTSDASASMRALDRLLPLADRVNSLIRGSGRAVVDSDSALATALLADGGEGERCAGALRAAWTDLLAPSGRHGPDTALARDVLASLDKITDLGTAICREVIDLPDSRSLDLPSLRRLAEIVPDMLRDALVALRDNDRPWADDVVGRGFTVDTCFAQANVDVLQIARQGAGRMNTARQLHAVGRALERIGDVASDIADNVQRPADLSAV